MSLGFLMLLSMLSLSHASPSGSSPPSRVNELVDRVVANCLSPDKIYQPVFLGLDEMNETSDVMTALMIGTGLQEGYVDRSSSPRYQTGSTAASLNSLRARAKSYANDRRLNEFQRACLAQCVGYQWYKDTPENAPSEGNLERGEGNCRHSTYMARDLATSLGLESEIVNNGVSEIFRGIGHTFSRVRIEGRSFVMNNNLASDSQRSLCAFRFSRTWEDHRECPGFLSSGHSSYFLGYSRAWNRDTLSSGAPNRYSGTARTCGDLVHFESHRASGVLVRPHESRSERQNRDDGALPALSSDSPQ
jgi:hypothetical protein